MSTTLPTTFESGILRTAVLPFFHTAPQQGLIQRLERTLQANNAIEGGSIQWRSGNVTDFRGHQIPVGADRLVRWDYHRPDHIFFHGFEPPVAPKNPMSLTSSIADLGSFASGNPGTIFVSAVSYYRDEDRAIMRWVPRNMVDIYEYEIFAGGGIDVESTLGPSDFQPDQQKEIAFPGGIRRELIRSARQYDKDGRLVSLWYNPYFDVREAGARIYQLPDPICTSDSIDTHYWINPTDPQEKQDRNATCRAMINPMRGEGAPMVDEWMTSACRVSRPARAAFVHPLDNEKVFWFAGNMYGVGRITDNGDYSEYGPDLILDHWSALRDARFSKVDAVVWNGRGNWMYFFSQDEYALIDIGKGPKGSYIVRGPEKIASGWPSLKEVGCKTVDAILPYRGSDDEAYFFCGTKYVGIRYDAEGNNSIIQGSREIVDNWPSLSKAGFKSLDMVLFSPHGWDESWFFSGEDYVRVKLWSDTSNEIVAGPMKLIYGPQSLKDSGFYEEAPKA